MEMKVGCLLRVSTMPWALNNTKLSYIGVGLQHNKIATLPRAAGELGVVRRKSQGLGSFVLLYTPHQVFEEEGIE